MVTKKKTGTAVVSWEADMAARAVKVAATEKPRASFAKISIKGGILAIDDDPVPNNEMSVVVVAALHENSMYDGAYQPGVPKVPVCYSFGNPEADDPEAEMVPHPEAEQPEGAASPDDAGLEGANCGECWANRMGSADVGRGKACKNTRRLALISVESLEDADTPLADAEVRVLSVPVMSVKNWAKFAKGVADDFNRPYWGAVCKIKVVPDAKAQYVVQFKMESLVEFTQESYEAMTALNTKALSDLGQPYPKQADLDAAAPPQKMVPKGRLAQKAVAGKGPPAKKGKF